MRSFLDADGILAYHLCKIASSYQLLRAFGRVAQGHALRKMALSQLRPVHHDVVSSEARHNLERPKQVHIVIPEGTKVLTRPGGRVGIVVHAPVDPEHNY